MRQIDFSSWMDSPFRTPPLVTGRKSYFGEPGEPGSPVNGDLEARRDGHDPESGRPTEQVGDEPIGFAARYLYREHDYLRPAKTAANHDGASRLPPRVPESGAFKSALVNQFLLNGRGDGWVKVLVVGHLAGEPAVGRQQAG